MKIIPIASTSFVKSNNPLGNKITSKEIQQRFHKVKKYNILCFIILWISISVYSQKANHTFEIKDGNFVYDGKNIQIHSGEMHYPRVPHQYWRQRFKMMRAMGLNTVATYVFWNFHNTAPGVWDFSTGNHNLAEYIQTAQEEGLFVILRPGPYVCAEWEFGGYPWWLQQNKNLIVRSNGPFLDSCRVYIQKVADQVKKLQITQGGPIIMIQVENEFGSYVSQRKDISAEEHQKYYFTIKDLLSKAGFDAPFFTSDGTSVFDGGAIPGILPTANGEGNIENLKNTVNKFNNNNGPYMVAEYYPGWLDHWGEPFVKIDTLEVVKQIEKYLQHQINFNFYMVHGGTNFGFTSGANYTDGHDIQPDITSYDYDAPISEAGGPTTKYYAIRNLMQKYSSLPLPAIPTAIPIIKIPDIKLDKTADLLSYIKRNKPIINNNPQSFEEINQGQGYILYSRHFTQAIQGKLKINGLRDFATVYINGKKTGILNRASNTYSIDIILPSNAVLDILTENMGRINYGARITDNTKGITSDITINDQIIKGAWVMYPLPMDKAPNIEYNQKNTGRVGLPALYRGSFKVNTIGDTYMDMTQWGKGIVFINGNNLGRYWNVGPQQTLYVPGCWLKKGTNQVIVFEQLNDTIPAYLKTTTKPILENLKHAF